MPAPSTSRKLPANQHNSEKSAIGRKIIIISVTGSKFAKGVEEKIFSGILLVGIRLVQPPRRAICNIRLYFFMINAFHHLFRCLSSCTGFVTSC